MKKIAATISIFIALLLLSGIIITSVFKDEIIRYLVKDLNKYVTTEINIGKIDFTVFRKFPNASVHMKQVTAQSTSNVYNPDKTIVPDTLFSLQDVYFPLNLLDVLRKNYIVKKIEISGGAIHSLVDSRGEKNFIFWKKPAASEPKAFNIDLKLLKIKDVKVLYVNYLKEFYFSSHINDLFLRGQFSDARHEADVEADYQLETFSIKGHDYATSDALHTLDAGMQIDGDSIQIRRGKIVIDELPFNITGLVVTSQPYIALNIKAEKLNLVKSLEVLPIPEKENLNALRSSGNVSLNAAINGRISHKRLPAINISYGIENGMLKKRGSGVQLKNITFTGKYTNGHNQNLKTSALSFERINATVGGNTLNGNLYISNFQNPNWNINLKGKADLNDVFELINVTEIESMSGEISSELNLTGKTAYFNKISRKELAQFNYSGFIALKDAAVELDNNLGTYQGISGMIRMESDIRLENFSFVREESDFLFNGIIHNLPGFLFLEDENLTIEADVVSQLLNLTPIIQSAGNKPSKATEEEQLSREISFPERIRMRGTFEVKSFAMNRFQAQNARGRMNYDQKRLTLNAVYFETVGGSINGGGVIAQKFNKDFAVRSQTELRNIDIQKLFFSFNNFGQDVLKSDHIKGEFNGNITFAADWTKDLNVIEKSIECQSDFRLSKGELIDFTPLLGLSKFIRMEELRHIKFSTIENRVFIKDKVITIPQMDISSSALAINAYGLHRFDNSYDYHVRLLMSDILGRKARENTAEMSEFGPIEDDGLGRNYLPLRIKGRGEEFNVSYDFKSMKKSVKENLRAEKARIREILKDEFGTEIKSETDSLKINPLPDEGVRIQWDETMETSPDTLSNKPVKAKKDTVKKHNFIFEWEEDDR
ncbi:MAG: AsmA-like C-terminal region-containing protein [Bacteroidota bacterium]